MDICSGSQRLDHREIVYNGGICPMCAAVEEIKSLEEKKEDLEITIEELKRGE